MFPEVAKHKQSRQPTVLARLILMRLYTIAQVLQVPTDSGVDQQEPCKGEIRFAKRASRVEMSKRIAGERIDLVVLAQQYTPAAD